MKNTLFQLLTFVFAITIFPLGSNAQISKKGSPLSINLNKHEIHHIQLDEPIIHEGDKTDIRNKNLIFAVEIPCNLDFIENATLDSIDQTLIYRLQLSCKNAKSLYPVLSNFHFGQGVQLYVYTPDYRKVLGAFSSQNNKESGILPIMPLAGEDLIFELNVERGADFNTHLNISSIWYDYKGIVINNRNKESYGLSGDCNVDINCYPGSFWEREKHAVCRLISNGQICTGSLINNTRFDARPFFLTANHCINSQEMVDNMIVVFNYESPECYGADGLTEQSISGGLMRATTSHLDFCLIELSQTPLPSYHPYYLGWSLSEDPAFSTTAIHHPQGDVKKISEDHNSPVTDNYGSSYDYNSHWRILEWDVGTTEGGSSGSPLFNEKHQLVGTLTGGEANCSHFLNDYFSKFSMAWDEYTNSDSQLKYWLDPDNLSPESIPGFNPYFNDNNPIADFYILQDQLSKSEKPIVIDLSQGLIQQWEWWIGGAVPDIYFQDQFPEPQFNNAGNYNIVLSVQTNQASASILKEETLHIYNNCFALSNKEDNESYQIQLLNDSITGYLTGNNSMGFTAIAEKYSMAFDSIVYGVNVLPMKLLDSGNGTSLVLKLMNGGSEPKYILSQKTLPLSSFTEGNWKYIPFDIPVPINKSFYVSYEIINDPEQEFAVGYTPSRNRGGKNTCWVKMLNKWYPLNQLMAYTSISLALEPKLCPDILSSKLDQQLSEEISLYPNPAKDFVTIELNQESAFTPINVMIYNNMGQLVFLKKELQGNNELTLDVSQFSSGIYSVKLYTDKQSYHMRFMKD